MGIATIRVVDATNCTVKIPPFSRGTKDPVVLTATRIDQTKASWSVFRVTNTEDCPKDIDPVLTTLELETGGWLSQTFAKVPRAESFVTLRNGAPGLRGLTVKVNGTVFRPERLLRDNDVKSIDVASAMKEGDTNTITLTGHGPAGASALVLIADSVAESFQQQRVEPQQTGQQGPAAVTARSAADSDPRPAGPHGKLVWGRLTEETRGR